jgi:tetratricopeptide (TPR) repeat protein
MSSRFSLGSFMRAKKIFLVFTLVTSLGYVSGLLAASVSSPATSESELESFNDIVNIDALVKKVIALNNQKQHEKAINLLLKAVEKEKADSLLHALLSQSFDLFLFEEINRGEEQIIKNPKNDTAYVNISGAYELQGKDLRAMEILLKGIAQNPTPKIWMKIAHLELKAGRKQEALAVFQEVIKLDPKNSMALNNAAYILASTNNIKEAEKLAKKAVKLEPKNPEYLDTLALVYFKKGQPKEAENLIKEAIKLAPENEHFKKQLEKFL